MEQTPCKRTPLFQPMKRYLFYVALISLSTLLFAGPPIGQVAKAAPTNNSQAIVKNAPTPTAAPTAAVQPAQAPETAPTATAPAFDANNPTTWPTCAAGQIVWAQDGQCHNSVTQTVSSTASSTVAAVVNTGAVGNCGDNYYASYIYGMESGGRVVGNCNPTEYNSSGCLGIGQACPASKLLAVCPNADYACENSFFTSYAQKYCYLGAGTNCWEGSYNFWKANGWW